MRAQIKALLMSTPLYAAAKEIYRHAVNRDRLRSRRHLMAFYEELVPRNGLVFDVGANRGEFADAFLRLGATVVAIEPHPTCIAELRALYGRNARFVLVACALGAVPGTARLYLGEHGMDNMSTLSEEFRTQVSRIPGLARAGWNRSVEVPLETLDNLMARHGRPDFCKIDVEGYDLEVLRGLSVAPALTQFEYHPWNIEKAVACVERLASIGANRFNLTMAAERDGAVSLRPRWMDATDVTGLLRGEVVEKRCLGDVLART